MAKAAKKTTSVESTSPVTAKPVPVKVVKEEDQKGVPAGKSGDQKSAPAKKVSNTVTLWRAQPKFDPKQKIVSVKKPNPKSRGAATRYDLYKEGMTVQEYQDTMKAAGFSPKLAMADMRWDFVSGFITIK